MVLLVINELALLAVNIINSRWFPFETKCVIDCFFIERFLIEKKTMKNERENIDKNEEDNPAGNVPEDLSEDGMGNLNDDNESLANDLEYDEATDSYELDVEGTAKDYRHPDPYDTSAKDGEDMNSDWDEANLVVGDEYNKRGAFDEDMEESAIHINHGGILELDPIDEALAETPEDFREDLDEEGYPKNDGEVMP